MLNGNKVVKIERISPYDIDAVNKNKKEFNQFIIENEDSDYKSNTN